MSETRVKVLPGIDAVDNNLGYLNPEPRIVLPYQSDILAYFRPKVELEWALNNMASQSAPNAVLSGAGYFLDDDSLDVTSTGYAYVPGLSVKAPATIITVFYQTATASPRILGGTGRNTGAYDRLGMIHSGGSDNYIALVRRADGTATSTAGMPASGGDRWEMLVSTFDNVGNTIKLRRPRTGTETSVACTTWPASPPDFHLAGGPGASISGTYTGPVRVAFSAVLGRVLTASEIDNDIYGVAAPSLQVGGINI